MPDQQRGRSHGLNQTRSAFASAAWLGTPERRSTAGTARTGSYLSGHSTTGDSNGVRIQSPRVSNGPSRRARDKPAHVGAAVNARVSSQFTDGPIGTDDGPRRVIEMTAAAVIR